MRRLPVTGMPFSSNCTLGRSITLPLALPLMSALAMVMWSQNALANCNCRSSANPANASGSPARSFTKSPSVAAASFSGSRPMTESKSTASELSFRLPEMSLSAWAKSLPVAERLFAALSDLGSVISVWFNAMSSPLSFVLSASPIVVGLANSGLSPSVSINWPSAPVDSSAILPSAPSNTVALVCVWLCVTSTGASHGCAAVLSRLARMPVAVSSSLPSAWPNGNEPVTRSSPCGLACCENASLAC